MTSRRRLWWPRRWLAASLVALVATTSACRDGAQTSGATVAPPLAEVTTGPPTTSGLGTPGAIVVFPAPGLGETALVAGSAMVDAAIAERIAPVLAEVPPDSCVVVHRDGRPVVAHQPDRSLIPASTQKLLTALTALDLLGVDTRLRTTVRAAAPPADGVVDGDLYLVGGGDPLLATADYVALYPRPPEPRTPLESLADAVAAAGVVRVTGAVVGDESLLDTERVVPSWPPHYQTDNEVGPLSALTINDGFAAWIPEAIRGDDPARSAAATFSRLLAERGVAVEGEPAAGMAPQGAVEIAGIDSAPLRDVAAEALRESDNTTAELLLKLVGRYVQLAPSTAGGAAVVEAHLGALGLPLAGTDVVDGSGLDRGNRVTCDLMVGLLDRVGPDSVLASGLAVAGETGTLIRRFQGTPVQGVLRAKSGSINGVLTLAGMVDLADGSTVSFAVLQNGPGVDRRGHAVWENLLAAILGVPSWKT